jgi:hypothetical protein
METMGPKEKFLMSKRKDIEEILNALDIGFSDIYKDENVRQLTLEKQTDFLQRATTIMKLEQAMNFSLFSSLGNKHPSVEICYAFDFPSDLRASIYLLLGGYYRQAIFCIRNWMEIRLTGIYYGFIDRNPKNYKDWKSGKIEGPFGRTLIGRLFSRSEFRIIDKRTNLRKHLEVLYGQLSAFTHGGGIERFNLQSETDNVPRFNPKSVQWWFIFLARAFSEVALCFITAYGKQTFSSFSKEEIKALYAALPPLHRKELKRLGV